MEMLSDYVLLEEVKDNVTSGGIALPESRKTEFSIGKVIAVGPGLMMECGVREPMGIQPGDKIKYITKKAYDIDIDGKSYKVINANCVICIL
jgi:chaperonin GroES